MTATVARITRCARPTLRVAPTPAETLRQEIAEVCGQIDRRLGRPMGATEVGLYFWFWPATDITSLDVLERLHADAVAALADATAGSLR